MKGLKSKVWSGGPKRKVAAVVAAFLAVTSTASAALFLLFSGAGGGGTGTFATSTSAGALTYSAVAIPALGPGDVSSPIHFSVNNADPEKAHGVVGLTASFTSTPSVCAASLSAQNINQLVTATNLPYAPGQFNGVAPGGGKDLFSEGATGVTVTLAAGAPAVCADGTWQLNLTGATTSS